MAGTVTVTEREMNGIKKVTFAWTSSAGGAADGASTKRYTGEVRRLVTKPSAGSAPTDDYDVVVNDDDGFDALMGAGANRDTTNPEQVLGSSLGIVLDSLLTLAVTNAGNAKQGTVVLYIR